MKKLLILILMFAFSLSALACGGDSKGKKGSEEDNRIEYLH